MSLPLKVNVVKINQSKTLRFGPTMSVSEACRQIQEKTGEGGDDHGLFQRGIEGKRPSRWLRPERTLQYYDLKANDELDFKKKHRPCKVRLLDDTKKTILIDDSKSVEEIVAVIGKKIGLKSPEEFSLQIDRRKGAWLTPAQTLHEQGVKDDDELILKKRFFVDDANVGRDDPVQLHLVYVQSRDALVDGTHPCTEQESVLFAALQCQIDFGNHNPSLHKSGFLKPETYVPPPYRKPKTLAPYEKKVVAEYKKLVGMTEINAKYRYVQLCRSLKTYGITFYECSRKVPKQKKPQTQLMGVTRDAVVFMEPSTKEMIKEYPLTHLKRWAASPASFTLDFGDYEDEYININTKEGESMAQLISGYIDILLKKRKDTGVVLEEDDSEVGSVDSVGRIRGVATASTTSSVSAGHQSTGVRTAQLSPQQMALARRAGTHGAQTIQVSDPQSALRAISDMIENIDAKGQPVPGAASNLTPKQWSNQLTTNSAALAAAAGKLIDVMNAPEGLDINQMNNYAREIAMACGNMLSSARNASAGLPDDDMPLFDGAKAVAEAIKNILQASKDLATDPNNPEKKAALQAAQQQLQHAGKFLEGASKGALADDGAKRLLLESAKAVAAATEALCGKAEGASSGLNGPQRDKLLQAAKQVGIQGKATTGIAETLAPVVLDPSARQEIESGTSDLNRVTAMLLAAAKEGGLDPGQMEGLSDAAKRVNDALSQLLNSTELAEAKSGREKEFAEAANDILHGTAQVLVAKGKPNVIKDQAQNILQASGRLIGATKQLASEAPDEATRNRLLACAKKVADSTKALMANANTAAQNPNDEGAFDNLANASRQLGEATRLLVGDATRDNAMKQLRTNSKTAAASTTALISAAQLAAAGLEGTPDEQNLLSAAKAAADALKNLISATADATKNPDDVAANQRLMEAAKQVGPNAFALVAASKQATPNIHDQAQKQNLVYASNEAGNAVKSLMEAMRSVANVAGVAEIEEALEVFDAVGADLESALMFADSGSLKPMAGQTREDALELLNVAVKAIANSTKEIALSKDKPDNLGNASRGLSKSVAQIVDASKSVASTSQSKATQKNILESAKNLNAESVKLTKSARALVENPGDANMANLLSGSVKSVADALQALIASSKGSDPGAKEVDETLKLLKEEAGRINRNPVKVGGDFKGPSDELIASARALGAASQHMANTAKSNPAGLGPAVQGTAQTIPALISAANAAAGATTDKQQEQKIIATTGNIAQNVGLLLQKSRAAAAKPDDPVAQEEVTQAQKNVAEGVKQLMAAVSTATPAQLELEKAIDDLKDANDDLSTPSKANVSGSPYEALTAAAKEMAVSTTHVVKGTTGNATNDQIAESATKMAENLSKLVEATKATAASSTGGGDDVFDSHAENVRKAVKDLSNAAHAPPSPESKQQMINSAKAVAQHSSALVGAARTTAQPLKESDPQTYQHMMQAGQKIAQNTGALVNAAKNCSTGAPGAVEEMDNVTSGLIQGVDELLQAKPQTSSDQYNPGALGQDAAQLVNAAKGVSSSANQLLNISKDVVGGKKEKSVAQPQAAAAAKGVTTSIQALITAANFMKPGARDLEEAINATQEASNELQSASLNAAIGLVDFTAPPGMTYSKSQEEMVEKAREVATGVKDFVNSTRQSPEQMGKTAKKVGAMMPEVVEAAKTTAATTKDQEKQQEGLDQAKVMTDAVLGLMSAVKSGNNQQIAAYAKSTSESIGELLNMLKGGVMASREVDEAIKKINASQGQLDADPNSVQGGDYKSAQQQLQQTSKELVGALNNLVNTAKTNPDGLGDAAKKVSEVVPKLVGGALQTAASTTDAGAQKNLISSGKSIAQGSANLVSVSKNVASDRNNPQYQTDLSNTFRGLTGDIKNLISALGEGAVGEKMIKKAIGDISQTMGKLDQASLFSAAGQLEAKEEVKEGGEKAANDALIAAAKEMAAASTQLVSSSRGTEEQLGQAAQNMADAVEKIAERAKESASLGTDQQGQQTLLSGARQVAIATSSLVQQGKDSQANPDQNNQQALAEKSKVVAESLKNLVGLTQSASAEVSRGLMELDKAKQDIQRTLEQFVTPAFTGNEKADTEDVITSAKAIAESIGNMVAACTGGTNEELIAAAKEASTSTRDLMENSKGASKQPGAKPDVGAKVHQATKAVAQSAVKFLDASKAQKNQPSPENQRLLSETSGEVVDRINDVVDVAGELPGGAKAQEIFRSSENLEEIAEKELLAAAKVIEDAASFLLSAKKVKKKKEGVGESIKEEEITDAILDAARAIATATGVLVRSATNVQKELVAQGKINKSANVYRRDPTWAKGLISAAKSVAGSVQLLVDSANEAAQGKAQEEKLVAAAKGVAAATARLVSASRAKGDPMSESQQKLTAAAKAVANATAGLVDAAKAASELEEDIEEDIAAKKFANSKVQELEQQAKILALRKQLENAEKGLKVMRQAEYQGAGQSGAATSTPSPTQAKLAKQFPGGGKKKFMPKRPPPENRLTLEEIKAGAPGIDPAHKELWLKDEEYQTAFGMSVENFQKLPAWRKNDMKAKAGIH